MIHDGAISIGIIVGAAIAVFSLWAFGVFLNPSLDRDKDCIIVTEHGTVLYDPVGGEDDGLVYCPTGEISSSLTGKVHK
jgi:hypothetical protein